jgi:hypothetical protein
MKCVSEARLRVRGQQGEMFWEVDKLDFERFEL